MMEDGQVNTEGLAGFPFDDFPTRRSTRSHLDDLASRHPMFAQTLRQGWGDDFPDGDFKPFRYRERHGSGGSAANSGVSEDDTASSASSGHVFGDATDSVPVNVIHKNKACDAGGGGSAMGDAGVKTRKMPPYATRNTVDLAETQQQNCSEDEGSRSQRSWSAPPDARPANEKPKRYVSKIEITPMTAGSGNAPIVTSSVPGAPPSSGQAEGHGHQQWGGGGKPPVAPKSSSQQSKSNNVRHIPIFVEGRDDPVVPKDTGFSSAGHGFQSRPEPPPQQQNFGQFYRPRPQDFYPKRPTTPPTQQSPTPPKCQTPPNSQPPPPPPPPQQPEKPKPQQKLPNDPIAKVQNIQKAAEGLMEEVENFSGSRNSKDYLFLDEMLTRNLLKLDDIETEGRDDIRQARKEAIRSINRCISILESKAPLEGQQQVMETEEEVKASEKNEESTPSSVMEVEESLKDATCASLNSGDPKVVPESVCVEEKGPEKMEVGRAESVPKVGNGIEVTTTGEEENMDVSGAIGADAPGQTMEVDKEEKIPENDEKRGEEESGSEVKDVKMESAEPPAEVSAAPSGEAQS